VLRAKPWQPDAVLRLLAGLFLAIASGGLLVSVLAPGEMAQTPAGRLVVLVVGMVTFHGVGLLLVSFFLRSHGVGWDEAFGFREPGFWRAMSLAVLFVVLVLPIAWGLNLVSALALQAVQLEPQVQQAVKTLQHTTGGGERLLFGLLAVGAAPFVEEVVFRGILYPFVKQSGFPRLAVWGTSFLFAATHANLMTFLPLAVLSVVLILLYEKTRNLLAPIVAHALFNLINLAWLLSEPSLRQILEIV
jgi:hypothetical protein